MNDRTFQSFALKKVCFQLLLSAFLLFSLTLPSEAFIFAPDEGPPYYVFSHADMRMCPSPLCGGMFIREVNSFLTRCSDGRFRFECYVSNLDLSLLGLQDSDASRVYAAFYAGDAIIRGSYVAFSNIFPDVSSLVAAEAWEGKGTAMPGFIPVLFRDNGIRCITYPCFWIDALILNTPFHGTISGLTLDSSVAAEEDMQEGYRSLSSSGIIANGHLRRTSGPAGEGYSFEVSRFYLKVRNSLFCGGPSRVSCPNNMFCDITDGNACSGQDLTGTCASVPEVCTMLYMPVCGCDGMTYSNDCQRQGAQVLLDHTGECTAK